MNRLSAVTLLLIFSASFLHAASQDVAITVYNKNLALIRDARRMKIKKGQNRIEFTDVASKIDPTSVHFKSLTSPTNVRILEQNYEYDLVNSNKILSKYIDEEIQLITKEGKLFKGKLLSSQGNVVLEKKGGEIQSISKSEIVHIDFPKLPSGLITRPTLVWLLESKQTGKQNIEVSYLTTGMDWHAEYVAVLDSKDKEMELFAWVSINNRSGATYKDAKLKLVAGDIHRVKPPPPENSFF